MEKKGIKFLMIVLVTIQSVSQIQAQSKKDLEVEIVEKTATIDSLNMRLINLEKELDMTDSMAVRLTSLEVMYSATKDKVLKEDFDPNDFAALLDSAALANDSIIKALTTDDKFMLDSLTALNNRNIELDKIVDNCVVMMNVISDAEEKITREDVEKGLNEDREKVIHELKQLKDLFDAGILTKEEFEEKKIKAMEKW